MPCEVADMLLLQAAPCCKEILAQPNCRFAVPGMPISHGLHKHLLIRSAETRDIKHVPASQT